jgi:hypothetical protein
LIGEMFGVERLSRLIEQGADGGADGLLSSVLGSLSAFAGRGGAALDDDCTMVALEIER